MQLLFLDIETAPNICYTWGLWNQNIAISQIQEPGYTLCWAAKLNNGPVIFDSSKKMIKNLHKLMEEADAIVHYNGTKFDIPKVNKDFLLEDLPPPSYYAEIDLLKTVRKRFGFSSNKLDYVAQQLGIGSKVRHKGMDLWKECMAGDERAWRTMKRYNIQDVVLLQKLYKKLLPWIPNHPNHGVFVNSDNPTCRNCGSTKLVKDGIQHNNTLSYQRYRCKSCRAPLKGRRRLEPAGEGVLV